jgi:hypothetical protein
MYSFYTSFKSANALCAIRGEILTPPKMGSTMYIIIYHNPIPFKKMTLLLSNLPDEIFGIIFLFLNSEKNGQTLQFYFY